MLDKADDDSALDRQKEARRWKKELQLATKREKDWEREAEKIVKRYRGEEKKRNRFNVLWSNTEILRPAIYNSRPNPDVRRRFRDQDPAGKAVSEVLERALSVFVDGDETDDALKNDVLDGLLCGRGVSRIRYIPKISAIEEEQAEEDDDYDAPVPPNGEAGEPGEKADEPDAPMEDSADGPEPEEEVESETVCMEHVDWKDFRHGYGRVWPEVPWEGFRHKLSRKEAEEKFNVEDLGRIEFTVPIGDDHNKPGQEMGETEKVAEFWEIWDKVGNSVFFLHDSLEHLLYPKDNPDGEPPVDFDGFFPNPRPLTIVENTGSLLPTPIFRLYEDQATQLDLITGRIDKIVKSMRLRGIYDARIPEMSDLLSSDDNEMVPVQNAQQWSEGGLDKAVSWVPVEKNAEILEALYQARDKQKAIIDELLGISDIIRGATDPSETATAQNLKSNYGSVRLQRMQKEVQRYARDMLRLAAAAMSEKFSPETFTAMTELKFPTAQQKALMVQMFQRQQVMAQQAQPQAPPPGMAPGMPPGAPPGAPGPAPAGMAPHPMIGAGGAAPNAMPPPGAGGMAPPMPPHPMMPPGPPINPGMLNMPTWEDILGIMRSDKIRQFKIDVETDSTVAGTLSSDMQGLSQVLTAVSQTMTELAPMVTQGVLPVDSAKELIMAVIRRSRLGNAVEDAFDKMQPPKPPQDPHAAKAASDAQQNAADNATDIKIEGIKQQGAQALQQMRENAENQRLAFAEHAKQQREQLLEANKTQREEMNNKFDAFVKIIVATIGATKQPDMAVQPQADALVGGTTQRDINPPTNLAPTNGLAQ